MSESTSNDPSSVAEPVDTWSCTRSEINQTDMKIIFPVHIARSARPPSARSTTVRRRNSGRALAGNRLLSRICFDEMEARFWSHSRGIENRNTGAFGRKATRATAGTAITTGNTGAADETDTSVQLDTTDNAP
jgi:hypothetical protein